MTPDSPELTIIIPAYNEAERIEPTLDRVLSFLDEEDLDAEVIVVDDGSTDATASVVERRVTADRRLRLITRSENRGKGATVKEGAQAGSGEYILFSDADLSTDIDEALPFLGAARQGADIVIGSRVLPGSRIVGWNPWYRILSGRTFNRVIRILTLPSVSDTQCGFKMFSRAAAREIFPLASIEGFGFDVELLYIARHLGYRIQELPITWNNDPNSKINLLRHTLPMLADVVAVRLNARKGRYGKRRNDRS